MPGLRCSSFNLAAFAESGPTSVRVYECRGRVIGAAEELDDDSLVNELGCSLEALGIVRGGGGGWIEDGGTEGAWP